MGFRASPVAYPAITQFELDEGGITSNSLPLDVAPTGGTLSVTGDVGPHNPSGVPLLAKLPLFGGVYRLHRVIWAGGDGTQVSLSDGVSITFAIDAASHTHSENLNGQIAQGGIYGNNNGATTVTFCVTYDIVSLPIIQ
jgi:hypothetical protein